MSPDQGVSLPQARVADRRDGYGNVVVRVHVDVAPASVEFAVTAVVERAADSRSASADPLEFAEACCARARGATTYAFGVTSPSTPAAAALAGGHGVCQDQAHVTLAACRAAGVPVRSVSGHLLGDGGTPGLRSSPTATGPGRWRSTRATGRARGHGSFQSPPGGTTPMSRPPPAATPGPPGGQLTADKQLGITVAA